MFEMFKKACASLDKLIYAYIIFFFGAFLSVVVNFAVGFNDKISLSLDVGSILSIGTSVLLAMYVTVQLSKKHDENRYVKDLAVKRLEKLENIIIEKVNDVRKKPNFDYVTGVTNMLRTRVSEEINLLECNSFTDKNCTPFNELQLSMENLWTLFSGDLDGAQYNDETSEFILNQQNNEQIFQILTRVKKSIFEAQILINAK